VKSRLHLADEPLIQDFVQVKTDKVEARKLAPLVM
jgi:hypothetical protein